MSPQAGHIVPASRLRLVILYRKKGTLRPSELHLIKCTDRAWRNSHACLCKLKVKSNYPLWVQLSPGDVSIGRQWGPLRTVEAGCPPGVVHATFHRDGGTLHLGALPLDRTYSCTGSALSPASMEARPRPSPPWISSLVAVWPAFPQFGVRRPQKLGTESQTVHRPRPMPCRVAAPGRDGFARAIVFRSACSVSTRERNSSKEKAGADPVARFDGTWGIRTSRIASTSVLNRSSYGDKERPGFPFAPTNCSKSSPAASNATAGSRRVCSSFR